MTTGAKIGMIQLPTKETQKHQKLKEARNRSPP